MTTRASTRRSWRGYVSSLARSAAAAPREAEAWVRFWVERLSAAPLNLPWSIALRRNDSWTLFGVATPEAQAWQQQLAMPASDSRHRMSHAGRQARVPLDRQARVAVALWDRAVPRGTFESVVSLLELSWTQSVALPRNERHDSDAPRSFATRRNEGTAPGAPNLLNEVLAIGRALRADRSVEAILNDVATAITSALRFRSACISLRSKHAPERFDQLAFAGVPPAEAERLRGEPIPAALVEQLCDPRWQIGDSFFVPADRFHDIFGDYAERLTTTTINDSRGATEWQRDDIFVTPLRDATGAIIGLISVDDPIDRQRPAMATARALEIFANQAVIAIENARLYADSQQRLAEQEALTRIQRAANASLDLRAIIREVFSGLRSVLQMDSFYSVVYHHGSATSALVIAYDEGEWYEMDRLMVEQAGLHRLMLDTRQPLRFGDLRVEAERLPPDRRPAQFGHAERRSAAWIGTPLIAADNELIGAISAHSYTPHRYGERELRFLESVARQVAISLQNARLLLERERQIAQMQTLNNISKVTSSTLDLDQLFLAMYTEINRYRPTDTLLLSICDPDTALILQVMSMDQGTFHHIERPFPIAPRSYTDVILRRGEPLLIRDTREEESQLGIHAVLLGDNAQARSLVCVPLRDTSGRTFGMLSMQSYRVGEYQPADVDFLVNVANQVALNIQNATLFKRSAEQVRQLAAEAERLALINRVATWSSATLDMRDLLQRTVDEMGRMTNADQVRLLLLERERGLAVCAAEYRDTGAVGTLALPIAGNPAYEWFAQHRSSLLVPDAVNDPRFAPAHEVWRAANIRDVLIVPLIVKDELIGSIGIDIQAREQTFSERDITTCETIARQVATALENARLWEATQQSVRELTLLYDLSVSLASMLDLDEILVTLASAALEIERADMAAILLVDERGRVSRFAGYTRDGEPIDNHGWETHPAINQVMRHGRPVALDQEALQTMGRQLRSALLVPIVVKGAPVGVTILGANAARTWTEREQSLVTILAGQAASTIENARLFQSEQEKRRLADTLREVALALTSTLDLREVLEIILSQLQRVVPYDSTSVQLLRGDQLIIISGRELGEEQTFEGITFGAHDPRHPNHHVIETGQPYIVRDTRREYPVFASFPLTTRVRSWLGVPLIYKNELLGMITLDSFHLDFYTPEMADVALMFATQAAQAIAHARLFEQIRRFNAELEEKVIERTAALTAEKERLEAVHAITTALTASLDIDEIVLKSLELTAGALGVRRGSVLIRDPMADMLVYRGILTEDGHILAKNEPFNLPPGNLVEWTVLNQQPVVVNDVRDDPRWVALGRSTREIRSFIAVPLIAADVVLGVLMFNDRRPNFFNEEHLRLLSTIASEVAIAVHNAELYNFINEQATRLAELLQLQREETGKTRAILESIAEGVLVLDESESVVLYNRAASQVLHIAEAVVLGQPLERIVDSADEAVDQQRAQLLYEALAAGVREARQGDDARNTLLELPDQTIAMTFTPVIAPDGERLGVAVVLRDITREIEADNAKREFISTVSHELRTPLTAVKGYVELLLLGTAGSLTETQQSFLQVVKTNAERLNSLVEDLLEISRLENGKVRLQIRPVDLRVLIDDIVTSLRTETSRKRMQLATEIAPDLPLIEADPKRVSQVLANLLSNAHKYTRDGGRITVRVRRCDGMVQVDVTDTGVGIPADDLPKMFSRFFRSNNALKDEVDGTGLGLSIARSFVELHGGEIWVVSEQDRGSTFSFTLPIVQRVTDGTSTASDRPITGDDT